jgi:translation initiation factor 1
MPSDIVYSTDQGRMCPGCGNPTLKCTCSKKKGHLSPAGDGHVRVGRETKGRKGKGISLITGLPLGQDELRELARDLKRRCGTGGTVKGGNIEIQGEHRDTLVEELNKRGFNVKRSGG